MNIPLLQAWLRCPVPGTQPFSTPRGNNYKKVKLICGLVAFSYLGERIFYIFDPISHIFRRLLSEESSPLLSRTSDDGIWLSLPLGGNNKRQIWLYIVYVFRELLTLIIDAECDIPVPGIPGPGNFAPVWMVPVPVPEKFGPGKKYRSRYRKKVPVPVSEKIGPRP